MATLWSCPKSDCPPIAIAPVDVPESGESAGAEAERTFTTDEVAALLNVPLDTIHSGTRKAQDLRVIRRTRKAITEEATWSGG